MPHVDWTAVVSGIAGLGFGIAGVKAFFGKYGPVAKKYCSIAKDALDLVETAINSTEADADGVIRITPEEASRIQVAAIKLRNDLKS